MMTDLYLKLTKVVPTTETNYTTVSCIFLEHWVPKYCFPSKLLTDHNRRFVSKLFLAGCNTLCVNNITTTEYLLQTNGQT